MSGRPGVFIDRDGTLIELAPYLHDPAEVRLLPGVAESLRLLAVAGFGRVMVTNQSGVARGLYGIEAVEAVHERMLGLLESEGAGLEGIEICPHHPDFTGRCACRKPEPGMILRATESLGIDLRASWVIGDRFEDLLAGHRVGCRGILVLTGYGKDQARIARPEDWRAAEFVAWDFSAAVAYLIDRSDRAAAERTAS